MSKDDVSDVLVFEESSVKIDPLDLNREYIELPAQIAYWNAQYTKALEAAMTAKNNLKREEARVFLLIKETSRLDRQKLTIAEIEAKVTDNLDVHDAQDVYLEKEVDRVRIKGIVEAVHTKRDMLQSLGAKLRVEMASDPAVRERVSGATAIEYGGWEDAKK